MNIEEIINIVDDYYKLIHLVKSKIDVIKKIDDYYNTGNWIKDISFSDNNVEVICDDSYQGCRDTIYFEFPIVWLTKTNDELKEIVITARDLKLKEIQLKKEKENELKLKMEEEKNLALYKKLKEKYGNL